MFLGHLPVLLPHSHFSGLCRLRQSDPEISGSGENPLTGYPIEESRICQHKSECKLLEAKIFGSINELNRFYLNHLLLYININTTQDWSLEQRWLTVLSTTAPTNNAFNTAKNCLE
jgi:hypothetical protein